MSEGNVKTKPQQRPDTPTIAIAILATMTALVFIVTTIATTPIPGVSGQRFNAGDIAVFISGLTFGPGTGAFAGGVGSALSDVFLGGQYFAPFTFVIKGLEGYVVGYIARRGLSHRDQFAWLLGGIIVVGGYFLAEAYFIGAVFGVSIGLADAIGELPWNILQALAAGLVGIPASRYLKTSLPVVFFSARRSSGAASSTKQT